MDELYLLVKYQVPMKVFGEIRSKIPEWINSGVEQSAASAVKMTQRQTVIKMANFIKVNNFNFFRI